MKKLNSVRKTLAVASVMLGFAVCTPQALAIVPNADHGQSLYMKGDPSRGVIACIGCHGVAGNSVVPLFPNIAAQPYGYIVNQLHNFKAQANGKPYRLTDKGTPTPMTGIVAGLSDQDIADLAAYVSRQKLTNPAKSAHASDPKFVAQGRDIWRAGIPDRNVPACAACHGPAGHGMPQEFPRLYGQHPGYLLEQLQAFSAGYRTHGGHDNMMGTIANRMSEQDIQAVADYAAGLR